MRRTIIAVCSIFNSLLITSCNRTTETYPPHEFVNFAGSEKFAEDDSLPFQFPLDAKRICKGILSHHFVVSGVTKRGREYPAAEDYNQIPGTSVYAMTDGRVSFSGSMGGYGWVKKYPLDMRWMQPSKIIVNQKISEDGFAEPANGYMAGWWVEIVFISIYLFAGVVKLVFSYKKKRLYQLLLYSIVLFAIGLIFVRKGTISGYIL